MLNEFVSLHDVNISQIKIVKNGIRLVCQDCFTFEKEGKVFLVSKGTVLYEKAKSYDCRCYALCGKSSSIGEILFGIPITIKELNDYLSNNNSTIELFEEYYSDTGEVLLRGSVEPYKEDLGMDWKYVIIKIMTNAAIKYSGFIEDNKIF